MQYGVLLCPVFLSIKTNQSCVSNTKTIHFFFFSHHTFSFSLFFSQIFVSQIFLSRNCITIAQRPNTKTKDKDRERSAMENIGLSTPSPPTFSTMHSHRHLGRAILLSLFLCLCLCLFLFWCFGLFCCCFEQELWKSCIVIFMSSSLSLPETRSCLIKTENDMDPCKNVL